MRPTDHAYPVCIKKSHHQLINRLSSFKCRRCNRRFKPPIQRPPIPIRNFFIEPKRIPQKALPSQAIISARPRQSARPRCNYPRLGDLWLVATPARNFISCSIQKQNMASSAAVISTELKHPCRVDETASVPVHLRLPVGLVLVLSHCSRLLWRRGIMLESVYPEEIGWEGVDGGGE